MRLEADIRGRKELDRALKEFGDVALYKNLPRAMNRAGAKERTRIRRSIKGVISELKSGYIGKAIKLFRAKRKDMAVAILIPDKRIPLELLRFREKKGGSVYRFQGVPKINKRAFWVSSARGRPLNTPRVFERTSEKARPITPAYEKTISEVARTLPAYRQAIPRIYKNFLIELRRLLKLNIR